MNSKIGIVLLVICIFTAGVWCGQYTSKCVDCSMYKDTTDECIDTLEYCVNNYGLCADRLENLTYNNEYLLSEYNKCYDVLEDTLAIADIDTAVIAQECLEELQECEDSCYITTGALGEYKVLPMVN